MSERTLVFFADKENVLLAMKKRGFGKGKWNGYGGKLEKGETLIDAAVREVREESEIEINKEDLLPLGMIQFVFLDKPEWDQNVHLYLVEKVLQAKETEEMKPQIFSKNNLPFNDMWDGDKHFIPLILKKQIVEARMEFSGEGKFTKMIFTKPFSKIINP
jgi:8-oxo-dGTP pyrophosphatase MutT (NUDIX family)